MDETKDMERSLNGIAGLKRFQHFRSTCALA
jgi:hypothetical protein